MSALKVKGQMLRYLGIIVTIAGLLSPITAKADKVIIFAAASLRDALNSVVVPYKQENGLDIVISYASSGVLARQISQGAPASIYLSANEKWADWAAEKIAISKNISFLSNRLVLITQKTQQTPIYLDGRLSDSLVNSRLVIGNVNHVPAGIYAKAALTNLNLWPSVQKYIAQTPNVRAALLLVERGEAIAGITYQTDAFASKGVRVVDTFPQSAHPPIIYKALLIKENETVAAEQVFDFLLSTKAIQIYKEYGFTISGDE